MKKVRGFLFISDEDWNEVVSQDKLTLLFFMDGRHADCKKQIPDMISLADQCGGLYNVCVVDVTRCKDIVKACGVDGVPSLVIARKGIRIDRRRGFLHFHGGEQADFLMKLSSYQKMNMDAYKRSGEGL